MTYWFYTATIQIEENEFAISNVSCSNNKFFPIANVHQIIIGDGEIPGEAIGFNLITEISEEDYKYFQNFIEGGIEEFGQIFSDVK